MKNRITTQIVKTALAALSIGALCLPMLFSTASAQQATDKALAMSDIELIRAAIRAERVDTVSSFLELSDTEATAFWPLYKQYREDIKKVDDAQFATMTTNMPKYDKLTDKEVRKFVDDMMNSKKKKVDIQKDYIGKFAKILPPRKIARLYQLENKVDAVIAYELADRVPLVSANPASK